MGKLSRNKVMLRRNRHRSRSRRHRVPLSQWTFTHAGSAVWSYHEETGMVYEGFIKAAPPVRTSRTFSK
jgi:hypothetical protein